MSVYQNPMLLPPQRVLGRMLRRSATPVRVPLSLRPGIGHDKPEHADGGKPVRVMVGDWELVQDDAGNLCAVKDKQSVIVAAVEKDAN